MIAMASARFAASENQATLLALTASTLSSVALCADAQARPTTVPVNGSSLA